MLTFENSILTLFTNEEVDFEFNEEHHLLESDKINIELIPNCSQPASIETLCTELPPKTIRIWEDQVLSHQKVIESRLRSILGMSKRIHARETKVHVISQGETDSFILDNHMHIPTKSKYRYGLIHKDQLVAVAAFGRSCPIDHEGKRYRSHELIRFGNILNHTVIGGLGKLIKHFENKINPEHIMTYVDREWSEGKSYIKLGFKKAGITPPESFYLQQLNCKRQYRSQITQFSDDYLKKEGWQIINNLGNIKLVKILV